MRGHVDPPLMGACLAGHARVMLEPPVCATLVRCCPVQPPLNHWQTLVHHVRLACSNVLFGLHRPVSFNRQAWMVLLDTACVKTSRQMKRVGGGSDFVGLCGRKPHGGASYVQMSKRNRNTPPLTGYCTALERYPGRIAGVHLAGLAAGESPRVATPPILCPQCLACEALPAKAGQAPRRTVDHCYEARTRGLCALPSGVDANARPRVEPGFPPDAAWHRPPPWPWCVGSRGLTLCERPGHAQRPRPSTPAMQNIGTN